MKKLLEFLAGMLLVLAWGTIAIAAAIHDSILKLLNMRRPKLCL